MKTIKYIFGMLVLATLFCACSKDEAYNANEEANFSAKGNSDPFSGNTWIQEDQMGRPAVNTVFVSSGSKDDFNLTVPSEQGAAFQQMFQDNLMFLSPAFNEPGDLNALELDAKTFSSILATDVLTVSKTGTTTFFDGDNTLTGRALADDVITVELILIFGGETGLSDPEFPGLSDDNVDANDKEFLTSFPYLATPW
ncbi:DUF4331 family protein [Winogradskyella maritima]|uniref:DUF4331 family protein n=1 Tax=Winogradskyella maritima TaxID=1517766 RepID=A0ABV8AHB0_9FLAO|nr:DUF4331 family protein [Winogradskyella maritima]